MRSLAVINQKGGCGKTTTSINLAAALAELGQRVLLVDTDPQAHCALGLAVPEQQVEWHIGDAMLAPDAARIDPDHLVWQINGRLDLAPSTVALASIERRLADAPDRDLRLARVLGRLAGRYDVCIVDCPPSIGLLTFNALRACREVIIPVETGYFALKGAAKQVATIRVMAEQCGHEVKIHVLPNMYDVRLRMGREIVADLGRRFGDAVLPVPIHYNSKLKEAVSFGQPICEYDPASRGAQDYERLARHLLAHPPTARAATEAAAAQPLADPRQAMASNTSAVEQALDAVGRAARGERAPTPPSRREHPPVKAAAAPADRRSHRPAEAPADAPAAAPASRAAELVQRARALAARTRQLTGRMATTQPRGSHDAHAADGPVNQRSVEARQKLNDRLAKLYGVRTTGQGTLFVQPANGARRLAIAGDFNDWRPEATPLRPNRDLGVFEACVDLPPGRYRYRLVVDDHWTTDPHNRYVETNPFGELNNIVEVQ